MGRWRENGSVWNRWAGRERRGGDDSFRLNSAAMSNAITDGDWAFRRQTNVDAEAEHFIR